LGRQGEYHDEAQGGHASEGGLANGSLQKDFHEKGALLVSSAAP